MASPYTTFGRIDCGIPGICSPCIGSCCPWLYSLPTQFTITITLYPDVVIYAPVVGPDDPSCASGPCQQPNTTTITIPLVMQEVEAPLDGATLFGGNATLIANYLETTNPELYGNIQIPNDRTRMWVNKSADYYDGSTYPDLIGSLPANAYSPNNIDIVYNEAPFLDQQGYITFPNPYAGCISGFGGEGGVAHNCNCNPDAATPDDLAPCAFVTAYGANLGIAATMLYNGGLAFPYPPPPNFLPPNLKLGGCLFLLIYILDIETRTVFFEGIGVDSYIKHDCRLPRLDWWTANINFYCGDKCYFQSSVNSITNLITNTINPLTGGSTIGISAADYNYCNHAQDGGFFGNLTPQSAFPDNIFAAIDPVNANPNIVPDSHYAPQQIGPPLSPNNPLIPCANLTFLRQYTLTISGSTTWPELNGSWPLYWNGGNYWNQVPIEWYGVFSLTEGDLTCFISFLLTFNDPSVADFSGVPTFFSLPSPAVVIFTIGANGLTSAAPNDPTIFDVDSLLPNVPFVVTEVHSTCKPLTCSGTFTYTPAANIDNLTGCPALAGGANFTIS